MALPREVLRRSEADIAKLCPKTAKEKLNEWNGRRCTRSFEASEANCHTYWDTADQVHSDALRLPHPLVATEANPAG